MSSSLFPLKVKIIAGYALLVLFFLILLALIYKENRRMSAIDTRSATALTQRKQVEAITVQILDIALLSEQVLAWNENDIAAYRTKREKTTLLLQTLQKQITGQKQHQRIDSILTLLSAKETQTFTIRKDLDELRTTLELFHQRMPGIIRKTQQDKQELARQIVNNYGESEKKNGGLLDLFHSRKKAHELTDKANEAILKQSQASSGRLLHSLADEIQRSNKIKSERLLAHIDSLSRQNTFLNLEISRLLSELSVAEQQQTKEKSAAYLLGQEKSLRQVSLLGIGAMLLAIACYLILHLDLKKRYRYREQLEQLNRSLEHLNRNNEDLLRTRKNTMLAVSHDLRSPLSSIRGCAELLIDERNKAKRGQLCETILQSSDSMTVLLNALLNFYRLDMGKELPESVPFRLKSMTDTLEAEFRPVISKAGLTFKTGYTGEEIVVTGDRERMMLIVRNLLSNAVKFTPEGEVGLKMLYQDGILSIEVSDTGTGMTMEQTGRIFQPFERLENAEAKDGFGLGLPITQGLVDLLHGTIEVRSEPGKGSVFVVRLPLVTTEEGQLTPEAIPPVHLPSGLKILAIDDDAVLLQLTRDMLSRHRVRCDTCRNVQELTARIREEQYDLLITDIRMPKMNGFDLLELLRTSDIGNSNILPVLALTARTECREESFTGAGFAGYLYKPFSMNELLSAVRRCIATQKENNILQADFSDLLSGEPDGREMLELLIRETDKNMETLAENMDKEDREAISLVAHHLLPVWEIVRIEAPLRELCLILTEGTEMKDETIRNAVEKVILTGRQLSMQAAERIRGEKHG